MKKEQIVDFLYEEMSEQEKSDMLGSLESNTQLSQKIAELQDVRSFLQTSKDVPVIAEVPLPSSKPSRSIFQSRWWAIAASLLVLLVAGKLLDVRVTWDDQQFTMGFGKYTEETQGQLATQQQLATLQATLVSLEERLAAQKEVVPIQAATTETIDDATYQRLLTSLQQTIRNENQTLKQNLAEQIQSEQNAHVEGLLSNVMDYWDAQRREDLKMINDGIMNLAGALNVPTNDLAQNVNY